MTAALQTDPRQFARATLALLQSNAAYPIQTVLRAQQSQLEYLQLSMGQAARLAELGIDLFAQLRALSAAASAEVGPLRCPYQLHLANRS